MSTKNVESVTMKLSKPVFSTTVPLNHPTPRANASVRGMATQSESPAPPNSPGGMTSKMTSIPVAPVMAPAERSNSPPIISRDTATAMIPSVAATSR